MTEELPVLYEVHVPEAVSETHWGGGWSAVVPKPGLHQLPGGAGRPWNKFLSLPKT